MSDKMQEFQDSLAVLKREAFRFANDRPNAALYARPWEDDDHAAFKAGKDAEKRLTALHTEALRENERLTHGYEQRGFSIDVLIIDRDNLRSENADLRRQLAEALKDAGRLHNLVTLHHAQGALDGFKAGMECPVCVPEARAPLTLVFVRRRSGRATTEEPEYEFDPPPQEWKTAPPLFTEADVRMLRMLGSCVELHESPKAKADCRDLASRISEYLKGAEK